MKTNYFLLLCLHNWQVLTENQEWCQACGCLRTTLYSSADIKIPESWGKYQSLFGKEKYEI